MAMPRVFDLHNAWIENHPEVRENYPNSKKYASYWRKEYGDLANYCRRQGVSAVKLSIWPGHEMHPEVPLARQLRFFRERVRKKFGDKIAVVRNKRDIRKALDSGKLAVFLHMEDARQISSEADLERAHKAGVRSVQLVYNLRNPHGSGYHVEGGLSALGRRLVAKANALGMAVDVSHANEETSSGKIAASTRPVMASHSNAASVFSFRPKRTGDRNLSDEIIRKFASTGGIIGVTLADFMLKGEEDAAPSVEAAVKHIDHIRETLDRAGFRGIKHIGIASDFDMGSLPEPYRSGGTLHRIYRDLYAALKKTGRYSDEDIGLIFHGNAESFFERVLPE